MGRTPGKNHHRPRGIEEYVQDRRRWEFWPCQEAVIWVFNRGVCNASFRARGGVVGFRRKNTKQTGARIRIGVKMCQRRMSGGGDEASHGKWSTAKKKTHRFT